MEKSESNPLVDAYQDHIGIPSTTDEVYGYWVFIIGVISGFIGIALVMISDSPGQMERGAGIALAALGLLLLIIGPIIRLPLQRKATLLSYAGAAICLASIAWFLVAFPDNWTAQFTNNEVEIIGLYGLGIFVITLGSAFVPMLTSPREEQLAAEARAVDAESERDAALEKAKQEAEAAKQRAEEAEAQAKEAERQSDAAAAERAERERLEAELMQIEDSQSQFELYTDKGGKHRWRLRHRNRNIVADSSQGYSSRQKAQQGLSAVKRDAFGAGVVDLDKLEAEIEIDEVDEAVEGEDAPEFVDEVKSQATFETYEDEGGKYRYRLRHDNGNIIASSSQGYSAESSRDDAIERLTHYAQAADYLRIEPAAFELYKDKGGKYRWRLLHKNGNILADSGQGYASRQKARQGIDSVKKNATEDGKADFEVYEDKGGKYRWRLVHQNGNIIADGGQGYASESGAEDAVDRTRKYAPEGHVLDIGSAAFEIYKDEADEWRWRLRHRNGNILADSGEGYSSRTGAEEGVNSVKQNAPNADIKEATTA